MELTLEHLLAQLSMTKSAEADDKSDEKEDKEVVKEDKKVEEKLDNVEKKIDKEDDSEDDEHEKSASAMGAEAAREILEKVAMSKSNSASTAGAALGQLILQGLNKKADAGDMTTGNGIPEGVVPNKAQNDNAGMNVDAENKVKPMPTGNGDVNAGTVNEIFDAILADALSQGATGFDQVNQGGSAAVEGAPMDHATPNQVKAAEEDPELQKAAAVAELVAQGVDFEKAAEAVSEAADNLEKQAAVDALIQDGFSWDEAVNLVKQASDELDFEAVALQKAAALSDLIDQGFDFEQAVEMIKQADAGDMTTANGIPAGVVPNKAQADNAGQDVDAANKVQPMPTGNGDVNAGTINEIFDANIQKALAQGATGFDQVNTQGAAAAEGAVADHAVPAQVKTASLNKLIEAGLNFTDAVALVKEAAEKAAADHKVTAGEVARGYVAPGWMESHISHKHGKGDIGVGQGVKTTVVGSLRAGGRGILQGVAGGVVGRTVGQLAGGPRGAMMGSMIGTQAAGIHGVVSSLKNQAKEMHRKYASEVQSLVEQGVDFDQAVRMTKEAGALALVANNAAKASKPLLSNGMKKALKVGAGIAGGAALVGAGATVGSKMVGGMSQQKQAALNALVEMGVDFEKAAALVESKSQELYGE